MYEVIKRRAEMKHTPHPPPPPSPLSECEAMLPSLCPSTTCTLVGLRRFCVNFVAQMERVEREDASTISQPVSPNITLNPELGKRDGERRTDEIDEKITFVIVFALVRWFVV